MKIVQVVCAYPPYSGGIGTAAKNLSCYLPLDTITLKPRGMETKNEERLTYLHPLLRFGHAALPFSLFQQIKGYNLIYFHYPFFGADLLLYLHQILHPQTKLVLQYHMDSGNLPIVKKILSLPSQIIRNALLKKASKIIVSSLDYAQNGDLKKYYQSHPEKFLAIPFGVDTKRFAPRENINQTNSKNLLFVGGLDRAHYFKGVDNLLKALAQGNLDNWHLTIVGEGQLKEKYQALATELEIQDKITWIGKLDNEQLPQIYRQADVLVLPSINRHEAFGIVLLEAMASGLAVIASNLPGVRSVFDNNVQGLLVEPNNILDLQEKIAAIFSDPTKLLEMKKAARSLAEEKYDEEIIKEKFQEIIN